MEELYFYMNIQEIQEKRKVGRPRKEEPFIFFDEKMVRALIFYEKTSIRKMSIKLGYNPSYLSIFLRARNKYEITMELNRRLNDYIRSVGYSVEMLQEMRRDLEKYM